MKRSLSLLLLTVTLAGCFPSSQTSRIGDIDIPAASALEGVPFGVEVSYEETQVNIAQGVSADFSVDEIQNMRIMEEAYGVKFTEQEKAALAENKFVMKKLLDTNIRPSFPGGPQAEWYREFLGLYHTVRTPDTNPYDYKERTQANSVFLTSDIFFHSYNLLYVELLKEMENTVFYPSMKKLAQKFYEEADKKVKSTTAQERDKWMKVRNYFVIPYTLLSTAKAPLDIKSYRNEDGSMRDPSVVQAEFAAADKDADTIESATAFVKNLKLDAKSETVALADLALLYKAGGKGVPEILREEYEEYAAQTGLSFKVDFSQFTPRSHYTGSSLRRQYFRSIMFFSQIPFFLKSAELTDYAFSVSQLLAENPEQLADYSRLESAINFLVGTSDDLMPIDYLRALAVAKDDGGGESAIMDYLIKARNPKIKSMPVTYSTVGEVQTEDVLLATKGMRFFSGKFIIDSYWTGELTQGDEAPKPGYTQKLPPMASSLEVMALLGSEYAQKNIPTLDFYTPETQEAIDQAMRELQEETDSLEESYWKSNIYTGWLWTIRSLFSWQEEHREKLPRFMQSESWKIKTLMTASGFWTELRHATLLYAKQSFAELGGGGGCDERDVPPPPKGYIEPQIETYDRLIYLARRTHEGLKAQGFDNLQNLPQLATYSSAVETARMYAVKQLQNAEFSEVVKEVREPHPWEEGKECVSQVIEESDWEMLRTGIISKLENALPVPVEGPVLQAKDKRAAVVADVHTGGDSNYSTRILYEGVGVPHAIFVAVKDRNGARLTVGFTYAHYEMTEGYGGPRMTDEKWQEQFYIGDDPYQPFQYTPLTSWPGVNAWYAPLFAR